MAPVDTALVLGVPLFLALAGVVVWWIDRPDGEWGRTVRSRLLFGLPWGSLVSIGIVLAVYYGLQHGYQHPNWPMRIPYTSWSYLYPLGWLTAPFAHSSYGHMVGNLLATAVLAPLAEYAWSHFPTRRGESHHGTLRTNPYVRAFVIFPLGVVVVGYLSVLLHWGPVIGFSGVVFAFAGFAVVRYPIATVVAIVGRDVVNQVFLALRDPVLEASAGPSFSRPGWAEIAVQGHLLGFLIGVALGVALLGRREGEERPRALRLWTASTLLATSFSLWAIWWYRGGDEYVLYRGAGVLLVLALGLVVTLAATTLDRSLTDGLNLRTASTLLLIVPLVTMGFVAVPVNLSTVEDASAPGEGVLVRDYTVSYAEDVPNQRVSAIDLSAFGETTQIETSGVIVVSERRNIWVREISTGELAFRGRASVTVGGPTWEETVGVRRQGWSATGGGTTYQVWLRPPDGDWRHVYAADPVTARPVLEGRNVTVVARGGEFRLRVTRGNRTIGAAPIPEPDRPTVVGQLVFVRDGDHVVGLVGDTRVRVASKETYGGD